MNDDLSSQKTRRTFGITAGKPVICTLSARERKERGDHWHEALRNAAAEVRPLPDGVAVRLACDDLALKNLQKLVDLERTCCEWMLLDIRSDAGGSTLTIRAESEVGVVAIRNLILGAR